MPGSSRNNQVIRPVTLRNRSTMSGVLNPNPGKLDDPNPGKLDDPNLE